MAGVTKVAINKKNSNEDMFINLSNHPLSLWGEEQLAAARKFGEPEDMPFPKISPEWTSAQVNAEAEKYAEACMAKLSDAPGDSAVHVMGEILFCYYAVTYLRARGVRVVMSASSREEFRFIQFREVL